MAYDIGPRIGIEGEAEFRKQINNLTQQQKTLATEMQAVTSAFDKNEESQEKLSAKSSVLTKQIDVQKQKLDALKEGLEAAAQKYGENDKVTLGWQRAVNKATAELNNMQRELSESTSESAKLKIEQEKLAKQVTETSSKLGKASDAMGGINKAAGATALAGGAAALAVGKIGSDFEAQMSRVKAISGATGADFEALNEQAKQLGADTAYSATEAAQGMENLASAGFTTKEIMQAMPGMLNLAASSGEDLASSSDIAASTLRGFGLAASDAGHVADVLAKNAADTNAAVADTGAAMKYIAPVAQNAGWSLESVTAAIGEMADAGIKGEQAGTTLRGALTNLMHPSKEQAKAMASIGFNAYDANGKMKSLSEIVGELEAKTSSLTNEQKDNAIATIMGTNSLSGMQVLLKDGSTNLNTLTESLKNSNDSASEMAKTMQDNLKGAVEQLGGAAESAGIAMYEKFSGPATDVVSGLADKVSNLAESLSSGKLDGMLSAIATAAAAAAMAIASLNAAMIVADIINFVKAIQGGKTAMAAYNAATKAGAIAQAAFNLVMESNPIVRIVVLIGTLVAALVTLWNTNEGFRNTVIAVWNVVKETIGGVLDTLVVFFMQTIPNAWNSLVSFFTSIPEWWNNLWQSIGNSFTNLWNNLIDFMKTWGPLILAAIAPFLGIPLLIVQHWDQIKAFFASLWESVQTIATNAWNNLVSFFTETIPTFIASVGEWFQQLPYNLGYALGAAAANVVNFGTNVWGWVTTELPNIIQGIIDWFAKLPENIWNWLVEVVTNIGAWGANMLQEATTWVTNTVNAIGDWFSQLPEKIWAWLVIAVTNIVTWGTSMYNSAVTAATNTINAVIDWFSQLPGRIWSFLVGIVKSVGSWGTNMYKSAQTAVSNVVDGIIQWFSQLPGKMLEIGKHIVTGIWNGITGQVKWLGDQVKGFCNGLLEGFKKNLDIHSPSRLMADVVGKNIALGIGVGFVDAAPTMTNNMLSAMEKSKRSLMDGISVETSAQYGKDFMAALANGITENEEKPEKATKAVADLLTDRVKGMKEDTETVVKALNAQLTLLGTAETDALKGTTGKQKEAVKAEYERKKSAIKSAISLRKEQSEKEIAEIQRIGDAVKDQLAAEIEQRKEIADSVNDLNDSIKDALKEKYEEEEKAQEASLNKQLSKLEDWKNESEDRVNEFYDAKEKAAEESANAAVAAIQKEIDAMDAQKAANEREDTHKSYTDKISDLQTQIQFSHDDYNTAELQKQLAAEQTAYQKQLDQEAFEDKKAALQAQIDTIQENLEQQKAAFDLQKQEELDRISEIYEARKESLNSQLQKVKDTYAKMTTEAQLEAESEQLIMQNNQEAIIALLNSYSETYKQTGQTLGDKLSEGFQPAIDNIKNMIRSINSAISAARDDALETMELAKSAKKAKSSANVKTNNISISVTSPVRQSPAEQSRAAANAVQRTLFSVG